MSISKEIYREEYSCYIKEFNQYGLLTYEEKSGPSFGNSKRIIYNEKNKISRILETQRGSGGDNLHEERFVSNYEYSGDNYRVITYKTESRGAHEINSYEYLISGIEKWNEVDEIYSIQEIKSEAGQIVSERFNCLQDGTMHSNKYSYKNGLKISETNTDKDGNVLQVNYEYEGDALKAKESIYNHRFASKLTYQYQQGLLREEITTKKHNEISYISFKKSFHYTTQGEIEKTELYGRLDSQLHLCRIEEKNREGHVLTSKTAEISYYKMFMGHYDLSELHIALREQYMFDDDSISRYTDSSMINIDLDYKTLTIEKFDNNKNVVESKSINPDNPAEIYEKRFYHNEYNEKSQLELTVCFKIDDAGDLEEKYARKFYYHT